MANFYFDNKDLDIKTKTTTEIASVKDNTVTFKANEKVTVDLPSNAIENMGLKIGSSVVIEPISNGFILSAAPAKPKNPPATKGSSPATSMRLSNDDM